MRSVAETGSTNDDVKTLAQAGETEGLWLRADRQTGGRGRQGRAWESPTGNLFVSSLVRLRETDPSPASLALLTSLALFDTIESWLGKTQALQLKWPNDLLLSGAKLSGILLEREGDAIVIGIGVNLAHHPDNTDRPATSLGAHMTAPDPESFLITLAAEFAEWLGAWRSKGVAFITREWLARAHPIGTPLRTHDAGGESVKGTFDGLTSEGSLQLRLADGAVRVIHAGDVFLI